MEMANDSSRELASERPSYSSYVRKRVAQEQTRLASELTKLTEEQTPDRTRAEALRSKAEELKQLERDPTLHISSLDALAALKKVQTGEVEVSPRTEELLLLCATRTDFGVKQVQDILSEQLEQAASTTQDSIHTAPRLSSIIRALADKPEATATLLNALPNVPESVKLDIIVSVRSDHSATSALMDLAADKSFGYQGSAIRALEGHPGTETFLLTQLESNYHHIQVAAAAALTASPKVTERLLLKIRNNPQPFLIDALENSPEVNRQLVYMLGPAQGGHVLEALAAKLKGQPEGYKAATQILKAVDISEMLSVEDRNRLIEVMTILQGHEDAKEELLHQFANSAYIEVSQRAATCLRGIPGVAERVEHQLNHFSPEIRACAVSLIAGKEEYREELSEALEDSNIGVQCAAALAVEGMPGFKEKLIDMLANGQSPLKQAAAKSLRGQADTELIAVLSDTEDAQLQEQIIRSLEDQREAFGAIYQHFQTGSEHIASLAATTLLKLPELGSYLFLEHCN